MGFVPEKYVKSPNIEIIQVKKPEIGGKAKNLQLLTSIPKIVVPKWFVIPTQYLNDFLRENDLLNDFSEIQKQINHSNLDRVQFRVFLERFREKILSGVISHNLICYVLSELEKKSLSVDDGLAIRSSGAIEDSSQTSCAGLYETVFLKDGDLCKLLLGIKTVWISAFQEKAIFSGLKGSNLDMAVVIQEMIQAKASGVVCSTVLENAFPGYQIASNFGVGLSVVNGSVDCDCWVLDKQLGFILEQNLGSKREYYKLGPDSKIALFDQLENVANQFSLSKKELLQLFDAIKQIESTYQKDVDVEFAFSEEGNLYILQSRDLVVNETNHLKMIPTEIVKDATLLAEGQYSIPGVCSGRLVYVSNLDQLASGEIQLGKDDIVMSYVTTNVWTHYLNHIGGLITCEGSPMSHPMLLCRERNIACVIGIDPQIFAELIKFNGEVITLDGHGKSVFLGELRTSEVHSAELIKIFEPVVEKKWNSVDQALVAMKHNKMVIEYNGEHWRKTPTYPVYGFQAEINICRFDWISEIIRNGPIQIDAKYIDGYVCSRLCPFQEYVDMFLGYSLEDCFSFLDRQKRNHEEFLQACKDYDGSAKSWIAYVDLYAQFRAFIWAGSALQFFATAEAEKIAARLNVPRFYYEKCLLANQQEVFELDVQMQESIRNFAKQILELPLYDTYNEFAQAHPQFVSQLELLDSSYRFEHKISLDLPSDLDLVYERIKVEVKKVLQGFSFHSQKSQNPKVKFLLDHEDLNSWVKIAVESRISQCNSHHIDKRAKNIMRPKLIQLWGDQVFNLSIQQIESKGHAVFK